MHEAVTAAWDRVVESWDEPARHEAFLGLVAQHSAYAWAAARYKERAGDPVADLALEKVRKAATAAMFASAAARPKDGASPYKKTMIWLVVLLVMLVLGMVFTQLVASNMPRTDSRPAVPHTPARP